MLVKKPLVCIAKCNLPPRVPPDSGEANPGGRSGRGSVRGSGRESVRGSGRGSVRGSGRARSGH